MKGGGGRDRMGEMRRLVQMAWMAAAAVVCAVGNDLTANNLSLFEAQPAGSYDGSFSGLYSRCRFWTASRNGTNSSECVYRSLVYNNATFSSDYTSSEKGFSVRCVKN